MTFPPNGSAMPPAPPAPAAPTLPAVPPQGAPPPAAVPERRSARAELTDRLRSASTTEPGRLRIIGAVIAVLVIAFGAVTAWQMADRSSAADDVLHRSQPLSADAAAIYGSLADANTAAASGFLAAGRQPADGVTDQQQKQLNAEYQRVTNARFQKDLDTAAEKLSTAAASSRGKGKSAEYIAQLNRLLPEYAERIETARTYNRQGLPLGGAYLRNANDLMQKEMLPAAKLLYDAEKKQLDADYSDAKSYPWPAIGLGVVVLVVLVRAQLRNYRRTNRVFNHGLVAATAASTVVLLWLAVGHTVAFSGLSSSYDEGVRSLNTLNDARISILQARGGENLTLVARGAVTVDGKDVYEIGFQEQMDALGDDTAKRAGTLAAALDTAEDAAGKKYVKDTMGAVKAWQERHAEARKADRGGDYDGALSRVVGELKQKPTGECFDVADAALAKAIDHEQKDFRSAAEDGRGAMTGLPVGAAVLAVLAATGAVLGIGRRLSEYR
ncbi:hypothetical protein [Streptomyces indicus]|uniref:Secreted protein n=1 Tax=Streptomyces indicus TaxID=417292 RepID=A0A1G9GDD6_9ACTN|nr:hypothetical protein [Streptomyces indicus]SDK98637.1 hypothetical protein SAMN05421806_115150 [Streptomyces indicus]